MFVVCDVMCSRIVCLHVCKEKFCTSYSWLSVWGRTSTTLPCISGTVLSLVSTPQDKKERRLCIHEASKPYY